MVLGELMLVTDIVEPNHVLLSFHVMVWLIPEQVVGPVGDTVVQV